MKHSILRVFIIACLLLNSMFLSVHAATGHRISLPKINLPEIQFSEINGETEKEKLRSALRELDEKGLSAEKIASRIWNFLTRAENREKIGNMVDSAREKTGALTGKESSEEGSPADTSAKTEYDRNKTTEKESADKKAEDSAKGKSDDSAGVFDRITQEITDKAAEEISSAADRAVDKAAEKAREAVSAGIEE